MATEADACVVRCETSRPGRLDTWKSAPPASKRPRESPRSPERSQKAHLRLRSSDAPFEIALAVVENSAETDSGLTYPESVQASHSRAPLAVLPDCSAPPWPPTRQPSQAKRGFASIQGSSRAVINPLTEETPICRPPWRPGRRCSDFPPTRRAPSRAVPSRTKTARSRRPGCKLVISPRSCNHNVPYQGRQRRPPRQWRKCADRCDSLARAPHS